MRCGYNIDGTTALEFVELAADAVRILAPRIECLRIDDHGIDARIVCEAVKLGKVLRIIDEEAHGFAVERREMFLRRLERLVDALANGDARHDDDELRPPIRFIELVHGLDICVRLARSGLHLDGQVDTARKVFGVWQALAVLHIPKVLPQNSGREHRIELGVLVAEGIHHGDFAVIDEAGIDGKAPNLILLAAEHVADGARGGFLERLAFEFEFHAPAPLQHADVRVRREALEDFRDVDLRGAVSKAAVAEHGAFRLTCGDGADDGLWHIAVKASDERRSRTYTARKAARPNRRGSQRAGQATCGRI